MTIEEFNKSQSQLQTITPSQRTNHISQNRKILTFWEAKVIKARYSLLVVPVNIEEMKVELISLM